VATEVATFQGRWIKRLINGTSQPGFTRSASNAKSTPFKSANNLGVGTQMKPWCSISSCHASGGEYAKGRYSHNRNTTSPFMFLPIGSQPFDR